MPERYVPLSRDPSAAPPLYPDLIAGGGLVNALQAALTEIGSALKISGLEWPAYPLVYARVESGPRFSQVHIAAKERLFLFDFWARGVVLANGGTPDLAEMAKAIHRWVGSGCTTTELASDFAFVDVKPDAASYEKGEEVERRWQDWLANPNRIHRELAAFLRAASRRRELRQLFPYTSLNRLCFSRCTGYPYTGDTPRVWRRRDRQYEVVGPGGRILGHGDAEVAVRLVIEHLPPNCGPAVPGTAEDFRR